MNNKTTPTTKQINKNQTYILLTYNCIGYSFPFQKGGMGA
jgi:hypothetical protein